MAHSGASLLALTFIALAAVCGGHGPRRVGDAQCLGDATLAGTRGICHLQQRAEVNIKKKVGTHEQAPAAAALDHPPVFLTYCDGAFQPIFEVFHKCYLAAMGDEWLPHLLDLGASDKGRCHPRDPSAAGAAGNVALLTDGASETARGAGTDEGRITPMGVPVIISKAIGDQLESGRDVFRIDADAFIIENPIGAMRDRYPNADIVSSIDCAFALPDYCGWYRTQEYFQRHGGKDPLSDWGFMLNTGFIFLRSNARTIGLARDAERAVREGRSNFEQTALNEELVRRNCKWTTTHGPLQGSAMDNNQIMLFEEHFFSECDDGLKVVVLPMNIITRATNNATGKLAMHPGGDTNFKLSVLPEVESACEKP